MIIIDELENVYYHKINESYTSYMKGIAMTGTVHEIVNTILPCTWSYSYIGKHLQENYSQFKEDNFFAKWIDSYNSGEYSEFTKLWIDFTNEICKDLSKVEKDNLSKIFRKSSIYEIDFWDMAYDGEINMFSMLPLLLVSLVFSRQAGVTAGLITGIISLLIGGYILHPAQVILDYILPYMALGLSDILGKENKNKMLLGSLIAVLLNVFAHFLSGIIFFGQYAPEGMNSTLYSFLYNFTGHGVEGILCTVLISILPFKNLKQLAN
ncbi:MAG: energy-coupled thiamine transporter ThiT [Romboutsia sp.]